MSDTCAVLTQLCKIETGPDRLGRLSRAKYPRAPSTDLIEVFSLTLASPDCSFLSFPRGTKSSCCPTRMDPPAACTFSRLQNFPFPTPVSESETLLQLGDCLFPDFIFSTSNVVDGHANDAMIFLLCAPQYQNTRLQDGRLKPQTSGSSKKTVPPFSCTIGQSINLF